MGSKNNVYMIRDDKERIGSIVISGDVAIIAKLDTPATLIERGTPSIFNLFKKPFLLY
ncbi:MAG: hypothetical protein HQ575_04680 [Candidatus Omnitrophica bacterium]|nr:hypothetical protein [Candidatus Omnitrophota bacterium]